MTWDEFVKDKEDFSLKEWTITNIQCPKCNRDLYRYTFVVHATYPPKRTYKCFKCGWEGKA